MAYTEDELYNFLEYPTSYKSELVNGVQTFVWDCPICCARVQDSAKAAMDQSVHSHLIVHRHNRAEALRILNEREAKKPEPELPPVSQYSLQYSDFKLRDDQFYWKCPYCSDTIYSPAPGSRPLVLLVDKHLETVHGKYH